MANNKLQLFIRSDAAQQSIEKTIGSRGQDFTSSLLSVVNNNAMLQNCEPGEVIKAALKAASMRLPIDPNLGFAYIIPYKNGKASKAAGHDVYDVQFQIGYKGFIQLALRSGEIAKLNVREVKEGEFTGEDFVSGDPTFQMITDPKERAKAPVAGYLAYMKLGTGFEKVLYMTNEDLRDHARKYSQTFKLGYGKWVDDFGPMAKKTVLKLLISRWAPQSTEQLQKAMRIDQAALKGEDDYRYVDNDPSDEPDDNDGSTPPADPIEGEVVTGDQSGDAAETPPAEDEADDTPTAPTLQDKIAASKAKREAAKKAES